MPSGTKDANASHLSKDPSPPLQSRRRSGFRRTGGIFSPRRSPSSSDNGQLPSVIGSPGFHCRVPVVQGYTNLFPVDTQLTLLSISVLYDFMTYI